MLMTKCKPATIGEILVEEFMKPIGLTQGALAEAMGVQRKNISIRIDKRAAALFHKPIYRGCSTYFFQSRPGLKVATNIARSQRIPIKRFGVSKFILCVDI